MASPTNVEVDGSSGTVEIALGKHSNLSSLDSTIGTHDSTEELSPVYYSMATQPHARRLLADHGDEHKSPLVMHQLAPQQTQHEFHYGDRGNGDDKSISKHLSSKKDLDVSNRVSSPTLPSGPPSYPSQPPVREGPKLAYTVKKGGKIERRVITNVIPLLDRLARVVTPSTQNLKFLVPESEVDLHLTSIEPSKPLLSPRNAHFLEQWNQFAIGDVGSPDQGLRAPPGDISEDSETSLVSDFMPLTPEQPPEQPPTPLLPSPIIVSRRSPSISRARVIDLDYSAVYSNDPFAADSDASNYFSPVGSPDMDLTPKANQSSALKDHIYCKPSDPPMLLEFPSPPLVGLPHSGKVGTRQVRPTHPRGNRIEEFPKESRPSTPGSDIAFGWSGRSVAVSLDDPKPTPLPATRVHFGRKHSNPVILKRDESFNVTTRGRSNTTANDQAPISSKDRFLIKFPVIGSSTTLSAGRATPNTASVPKVPVPNSIPLWRRRATSKMVQGKLPPGKAGMSEALTWLTTAINSAEDEDEDDDLFDPLATPKASEHERRRNTPNNTFIFGPPPVPAVGAPKGPGIVPTLREPFKPLFRCPQATGKTDPHTVAGRALSNTSVMDLLTQFPEPPLHTIPVSAPAFLGEKKFAP